MNKIRHKQSHHNANVYDFEWGTKKTIYAKNKKEAIKVFRKRFGPMNSDVEITKYSYIMECAIEKLKERHKFDSDGIYTGKCFEYDK